MNNLDKYLAVRDQLSTGDLILWQTNTIIGKAIQVATKSIYSHASLVLRLIDYEGLVERRRFTTEAGRHGVDINMLSRRLERQDGRAWWFPLIDSWDSKRGSIGEIALSYVNVPYDYKSIFRFLFKEVSVEGEAMFCSELCAAAYGFSGIAPSPCDILKYGIFKDGVELI